MDAERNLQVENDEARSQSLSNAAAVKKTNDSCTVSKWSVTESGYCEDAVIGSFVDSKSKRRASLINRCYCVRYACLDIVMSQFFEFVSKNYPTSTVQVVVLGAGFDSSFWRLSSRYPDTNIRFVEVDFPDVCRRKCSLARSAGHIKNETILEDRSDFFLLNFSPNENKHFTSAGCDMTNRTLFQQTLGKILQKNVPTLVISEVVLVYLKMEDRLAVLSSVFDWFSKEELLVFFTYEQLARPEKDAFCLQMLNSFSQSQSPLLSYFTSPQEIENFWQNNFPNSKVVFKTCADLFYKTLKSEDRQFYCSVEPIFDEFEPYHIKCAIYFVVSVSFGRLSADFARFCGKNDDKEIVESISEPLDLLKCSVKAPFHCYAFSCAPLGGYFYALIGGFGCQKESKGSHGRLRSISLLNSSTGLVLALKLHGIDISFFDRLHGSATALSDGRVFVFGGRQAPNLAVNSYGIIKIDNETCFLNQIGNLGVECGEKPRPRFRHSACALNFRGREVVFITGGRFVDSKQTTFGDTWLYDLENNEWIALSGQLESTQRHSHSANCNQSGSIFVFGGLDRQEMPLSDLVRLEIDSDLSISSSKIDTCPKPEPRYGHSAEILNGNLFIVGGICPFAEPFSTPDIVVVNLATGTSRFFSAKPSQSPFMFINHRCFVENDRSLIVLGGGANCFSFGTVFNSNFLRIPVEFFLS